MPPVSGPNCPACNSEDIQPSKKGYYQCEGCQAQLSSLRVIDARGVVYSTPATLALARRQCAEARRLTGGGKMEFTVLDGGAR